MYDLMAQQLVKVLQPGVQMISSLDIHSSGKCAGSLYFSTL